MDGATTSGNAVKARENKGKNRPVEFYGDFVLRANERHPVVKFGITNSQEARLAFARGEAGDKLARDLCNLRVPSYTQHIAYVRTYEPPEPTYSVCITRNPRRASNNERLAKLFSRPGRRYLGAHVERGTILRRCVFALLFSPLH